MQALGQSASLCWSTKLNEVKMYFGSFSSKQDVADNFQIDVSNIEDCNILFASYDNEGYEGFALVIFSKDGKLYEVNGSHCSCHGLENQWNPEETSLEALKMRDYSYGETQQSLDKFLIGHIFEKEILDN